VREPERWDITVFKYPLQKNQNYVKRLVGMPGDRIFIGGGNLYQVTDKDGVRSYAPIRKPDDLQEQMWKNVYPARRVVIGESKALGKAWVGTPGSAFTEDDAGITSNLESGSPRRLVFRDEANGGFIDLYWDGYPTATAAAILAANGRYPQEIVPDARLQATVTADEALDELSFEIEVRRPGQDKLIYALAAKGGKARLVVRQKEAQVGASDEFALELPARTAVTLAFAHVDDQLVAWRDGVEIARFDSAAWTCRDGCKLPVDGSKPGVATTDHAVVPQIVAKGKGKLRVDDLQLCRDLHYTRDQAPEVVEVPAGHYYMMGDNTLGSIDSRGWTAVTVYEKDGKIVPKDTAGARPIRGNKRAMSLLRSPDRDETPIALPNEHAIVMIDEFGEILRLEADAGANWGDVSHGSPVVFKKPGTKGQDGSEEFEAETTTNAPGISFVPRSDIQGRALLVFYPCRPLSWLMRSNWPGRFGLVR
jgi:signal peptidase I